MGVGPVVGRTKRIYQTTATEFCEHLSCPRLPSTIAGAAGRQKPHPAKTQKLAKPRFRMRTLPRADRFRAFLAGNPKQVNNESPWAGRPRGSKKVRKEQNKKRVQRPFLTRFWLFLDSFGTFQTARVGRPRETLFWLFRDLGPENYCSSREHSRLLVSTHRGQKINANIFCTKFFENPSGHGRPHRKA